MNKLQEYWLNKLHLRHIQGNYRQLQVKQNGTDFYSNDYLGLARNVELQQNIALLVSARPECLMGATGSRLISGTSVICRETETFIAQQHHAASALLFPSGYKANLALFSCIADRGDTILVDEKIHRSIHDGCSLSNAIKWKFRHNDMAHMEVLIQKAQGNVFIAVETLYSMDGDYAPLHRIVSIAKKYGAYVIVDEAHAAGVFGKGLVDEYGLLEQVLAVIITYGKAFGLQGAAIVGNQLLKNYLVNYATPFIYSTAMPDIQLLSIKAAYEYLEGNSTLRDKLQQNICLFREYGIHTISADQSPVQIVQFREVAVLREASAALKKENCLAYAVYAPTVKQGSERLRVCLHQYNTLQEIDTLGSIIKRFIHG